MDEEPITAESLLDAYRELKARYPFAGFQRVENEHIPEGVQYWESEDEIMMVYEKENKFTRIPKPFLQFPVSLDAFLK